jgi:hypothetical protein
VPQVLLNLCVNARDACRAGRHLSLSAEAVTIGSSPEDRSPDLAPGEYVVFRVRDTVECRGLLDKIFDPSSPQRAGKGRASDQPLTIVRTWRTHSPVEPGESWFQFGVPARGGSAASTTDFRRCAGLANHPGGGR